MMHTLGMSMDEIMDLSIGQFLLYSTECYELEKKENERGSGTSGGGYAAPRGQSFGS